MSEKEQHEQTMAKVWDELGWSDELAQIKCEEADLDYISVVLVKSELLESLA